jgi:hypothetical protein
MFAEPSQTAKLKSILNQELGPLIPQQKSQLSVALASQEDGIIASIGCFTVTGGGIGFHGRQFVILDILDVDCGRLSACILAFSIRL